MNKLRLFRKKAGLTQHQLGELCGFTACQSRVAYYESGRPPALDVSRQFVTALNSAGIDCTLDDVFPPENGEQAA